MRALFAAAPLLVAPPAARAEAAFSTDRAWTETCPDATCRAGLLLAAIRVGLGATPGPSPPGFAATPPGDLAGAARTVAATIGPDALHLFDLMLRQRTGPGETLMLACVTAPSGHFDCAWRGYSLRGTQAEGGAAQVESLTLPGGPPSEPFALPAGAPPQARARDGRRVEVLTIQGGTASLRLVDDLTVLASALARSVAAGDAALGPGPFHREAVVDLVVALLADIDH